MISIQYKGKFYVAYIHGDMGINEAPIIEFYDAVFDHQSTFEMIQNVPARGRKYNDGKRYIEKIAVLQMKFLPDPANQVKLITSAIKIPPRNNLLAKSGGEWMLSDIFDLQQQIEWIFSKD